MSELVSWRLVRIISVILPDQREREELNSAREWFRGRAEKDERLMLIYTQQKERAMREQSTDNGLQFKNNNNKTIRMFIQFSVDRIIYWCV